jgi:ketosteroid isomerase-like protein
MKYLMILTVGVCLLFSSVPVIADQAEDEAAIREVVKQLYTAVNKHDVKAYVALCAENVESWNGDVKGRAAMEQYLSNTFANAKDIHIELTDEIGIVFVTPDVAIHKHNDVLTGSLNADGKRLSARIFVKKNGNWFQAMYLARPIEQ